MRYFEIPGMLYTQLVPPMDCSEKTEFYFKKKTTEICSGLIMMLSLLYRHYITENLILW